MNHGVKSLICLVLLTSNAAIAGWNTNAWPSESSYRIPVATNRPSPTNVWGKALDEDQEFTFITTDPSTNIVNTNTFFWRQGGFLLDVPQLWPWDTYVGLQERYRVLKQGTNVWDAREAAMTFKPSFYRDDRTNLLAFKEWIDDNLSSFVDQGYSSGGTYDSYFAQYTDWEWITEYRYTTNEPCAEPQYNITQVSYWQPTGHPESFPMLTKERLVALADLPRQQGTVTTNTYTADVPGWFACQTNVYIVSNHTFTVTNTTPVTRTWFDYTPYRDFGGWGQGLSNQVSGKWRFDLSDYWRAETQEWAIVDSVDNIHAVRFDPSTNSAGTITQALFTLARIYTLGTNDYPISTNVVSVYSPCQTNAISPAISITVTSPAYSVVVSNYSSTFGTTNGVTNIIFTAAYTNAVTITNNFAAEMNLIATNTTEADYGYSKMQAVLSNLAWTAVDIPAPANGQDWAGAGCNSLAIDNSNWGVVTDPASGWPYGVKQAASVFAGSPPVIKDCFDSDAPPQYGDDSCQEYIECAEYIILNAGCYYVSGEAWSGASYGFSCEEMYNEGRALHWVSSEQIPASGFVQFTEPTVILIKYASGCRPIFAPGEERSYEGLAIQRGTYTPTACELTNNVDCDSYDPYTYAYNYAKRAASITNSALSSGLSASRDIYLVAENPFDSSRQPDDDGFTLPLKNTFALFETVTTPDAYSITTFTTTTRPLQSNTIESKGYRVTGGLELRKWDFEY